MATKTDNGKKSIYTVLSIVLAILAVALLGYCVHGYFNPQMTAIPALEKTYSADPNAPEITEKPVIDGANSGWGDTKNPNDPNGGGNSADPSKNNNGTTGSTEDPQGTNSNSAGPNSPDSGDNGTTVNPSTGDNNGTTNQASPGKINYPLAPGFSVADPDPQTGAPKVIGPDVQVPGFGGFEEGLEGVLTKDTPPDKRSSSGDPISAALNDACPNMTAGTMCIPALDQVTYWHSVGTRQSTTGSGLVMAVPSTQTAGWLDSTAPLGASQGTSLFAAHVIFKGGVPGPFYNLNKLNVGDDIIMRSLNGKNYTYRVFKATITEGTKLPDEVYKKNSGPHQIALVTCTGTYLDGRYENRMIIWAAPVR